MTLNLEKIFAVLRGAANITENRETVSHVNSKGDKNFVTAADKAVQEYIRSELKALHPEVDFFAEEDEDHSNCGELRWILDPVDGTTNLMHDFPMYCVSLALADMDNVTFGAIYHPKSGDIFYAVKGEGAFRLYDNGAKKEKINVSDVSETKNALTTIGTSPYYKELHDRNFRLFRALFENTTDLRRTGSAALDCCYLAAGYNDIFVESMLQPWDYAAGSLIITEAGGKITDFNGNTPSLTQGTPIVATNGILQDKVLELVKKEFV